jgi:hypothetical protein
MPIVRGALGGVPITTKRLIETVRKGNLTLGEELEGLTEVARGTRTGKFYCGSDYKA